MLAEAFLIRFNKIQNKNLVFFKNILYKSNKFNRNIIISVNSPIKSEQSTFDIINKYPKALFYEHSYNNC